MIEKRFLKREEQAVFALRQLYRSYGYLPYKMSKFEEYEYYIRNKDFLVSDRIITFNDTNGRLLALKPDVTLSIVKSRDVPVGCKQKVCYNESIYRVSGNTHQFREITQTGLECFGDIDLYDIYETVSLAAQSLAEIGDDFILQISHLGILAEALENVGGSGEFRQEALACIAGKNVHDLGRLCGAYGVDGAVLTAIVEAYGDRDEVLKTLEAICPGPALQELKALSALLDASPYSGRIIFDFSLVGNMNYYNGIVFKGYLSGIADGILSGGRYDRLMEKLGKSGGAIGFALYLDLLEQLPGTSRDYDVDVLLVYAAGQERSAAEAVAALRAEGKTVSAQKGIPLTLRYRELKRIGKEGQLC